MARDHVRARRSVEASASSSSEQGLALTTVTTIVHGGGFDGSGTARLGGTVGQATVGTGTGSDLNPNDLNGLNERLTDLHDLVSYMMDFADDDCLLSHLDLQEAMRQHKVRSDCVLTAWAVRAVRC